MGDSCRRVLVVDLNNFARYPTVAVGYLASILRREGIGVDVFSPLRFGITGLAREPRETRVRGWMRKINYRFAHRDGFISSLASATRVRVWAAGERRRNARVLDRIDQALDAGYDAVLVSTYLMYYPLCVAIGEACERRGVPLILGGSYFAQAEVCDAWLGVPGLACLVGGEIEPHLAEVVHAATAGEDPARFPGVTTPEGRRGPACPPLRDLDGLPFPDYADFPWDAYPERIIPLITGRGCGWSACTFCSDITSSAGRTYRSRSPENVLDEISHQARRHDASAFTFVDLKLNSNSDVWGALLGRFQGRVPGARWIGAVHVGRRQPNGLGRRELEAARAAGMVRVTTGLESGSQRMLDLMRKGTELGETERFLREATAAGLSVRVTMIHGYPGERAEDVAASARLLERHRSNIDRVNLNRFQLTVGPDLLPQLNGNPDSHPDIADVRIDARTAQASHRYLPAASPDYRRATRRLLDAVSAINRRPLESRARCFEGVM